MSEPVCYCVHVYDEHEEKGGECLVDGCECFLFDEDLDALDDDGQDA